MIVLWFVTLLVKVFVFILALCSFGFFGAWAADIAEWSVTGAPLIARLFNVLYDMGAWLPGETLAAGLLTAASILGMTFCIKVARMILSLFTGGGGGAA